ncbi:DNA repair exonuclease [Frankia sp. AgB32]|uniref:metallophosphoesterase family protein n=1 Tax=Frankia sp. AgB32 TaxID=631119 RepID=UPI00200E6490|nr:DNA repair exonuclease [Frankia sp. AgB32]MCK9894426.1 DNA repair exonuclease [Frankia sp. AgB32]
MRLVHAADLHLDSPLRGLSRLGDDALAHQLREATRRALENLTELTVTCGADALLLAGDIYDGNWPDYATGRFFGDQLSRLHDENIPVFLVRGNHDAQSTITRSLRLPPNVTLFDTDKAGTAVVDDLGLAVHGQSYATPDVGTNLARAYPDAVAGLTNVGLLHTAVQGAEGHAPYAPCTVDDLTRTGYDYFALGHVHTHRTFGDGRRVAAYSGNLQGRHPREGGPKGALVVDLEPGEAPRIRLEPCDVARWATLRLDVAACRTFDDVLSCADQALRAARAETGERPLVARVTVVGASPAAPALTDTERLHAELAALAAGIDAVALEKIEVRATSPRPPTTVDPELAAGIRAAVEGFAGDTERLARLAEPLEREVGRDLRRAGLLDLGDHAVLAELARRAGADLFTRLAGDGCEEQ